MTSPFKYLTYVQKKEHGVCVHACAVEIKLGMLRAVCFIDVHGVRVWTSIRFTLQDGDFRSKKQDQYGVLPSHHTLFPYVHVHMLPGNKR